MTDPMGVRLERRRSSRIAPKGTAIVHVPGHAPQRGRIVNLGEGGVFVLASIGDASVGGTVDVELRLDGRGAEWLRASGTIVRLDDRSIAIAFAPPAPAALSSMIDEVTTASQASDRVMSVVLIDSDTKRRSAMAAGFRTTGCAVVEAATPLEAIVRLGESSFEPDVIAIANSYPTTEAAEMRVFVERDHPDVKLVTIGDELVEPDGIAHWLSSADPRADLPDRVREVLVRGARGALP
jgi:hypothetical protein